MTFRSVLEEQHKGNLMENKTRRSLAHFSGEGYDKGRSRLVQLLWAAVSELVVQKIWCPSRLRVKILRAFGAEIGSGVLIRHDVRIHWPWKLSIGNDVWIGVSAWLLNLEPISIGSDVCISQGVMLCTGSHQMRSRSFEFDNAPVVIHNGVWIGTRATVLRGVTIGSNAVVGATALVTKSLGADCVALAPRGAGRGHE